jgi:antirestriction protein ArdC
VFWKFANDSGESQDDGAESSAGRSRLLFTRGYSVFNAAQVDGYTPKADTNITMPERIAHAEAFFGAIGANVQHARKPSLLCSRDGPYPNATLRSVRR